MIPTKVDAAIVGSGAGGAVMAYELAARGMSVAVIERGRREDPTTFEHAEMEMFPRLYKDGGFQATVDRNLLIAQGATVGGSTVINNAIWLRADLDRLLPRWEQVGAYIDRQRIERGYEAIERLLKVAPVPAKYANKGTEKFLDGARALGLEASLLQNNRVDCIACGWCNYGCRYNRKTSALVTFIPWAEELGASVIDQALDVRVVVAGDRATGVTFVRNRAEHTITTDRVVVAGGAIGSSEILLRSGITLDGRVGSRFHAFAGVHVTAEFPDELNSYDGIGLCAYIRPSIDDEMVLENYFSPPGVFSLVMGGWFSDHFERMLRYRYFAQAGVQVATAPSGRITLGKKGEVRVDFAMSQHELDLVCQGVIMLGRVFLRAGALRVLPSTFHRIEFAREDELAGLTQLVRAPDDLSLGSAHPQGGNPMHEDATRGVVGLDWRVHGTANLFVSDTSVFPENIRANCQATVMALSHCAADEVAG